ncbi:MAG: ribonuclease P protein component [Bacteroidetes bacterium]|nr:ribonuclease P protein component [Bacteroidota bacterium]
MLDQLNSLTFKKEERLNSKKVIADIFEKKQSFKEGPFRIFWMETELKSNYPAQICISIPKKQIKKAVDRNTLKRRISEAYRKNKSSMYKYFCKKDSQCAIMLIYLDKNVATYEFLERKIVLTLERLLAEYEKNC